MYYKQHPTKMLGLLEFDTVVTLELRFTS